MKVLLTRGHDPTTRGVGPRSGGGYHRTNQSCIPSSFASRKRHFKDKEDNPHVDEEWKITGIVDAVTVDKSLVQGNSRFSVTTTNQDSTESRLFRGEEAEESSVTSSSVYLDEHEEARIRRGRRRGGRRSFSSLWSRSSCGSQLPAEPSFLKDAAFHSSQRSSRFRSIMRAASSLTTFRRSTASHQFSPSREEDSVAAMSDTEEYFDFDDKFGHDYKPSPAFASTNRQRRQSSLRFPDHLWELPPQRGLARQTGSRALLGRETRGNKPDEKLGAEDKKKNTEPATRIGRFYAAVRSSLPQRRQGRHQKPAAEARPEAFKKERVGGLTTTDGGTVRSARNPKAVRGVDLTTPFHEYYYARRTTAAESSATIRKSKDLHYVARSPPKYKEHHQNCVHQQESERTCVITTRSYYSSSMASF